MAGVNLSVLSYRMMRAAALDASVYEEVEADQTAWRDSLAVVLLASVAAGIGAGGWQGASLRTFASFMLIALVTWTAWAMLVAEIGGRLLPEAETRTSFGELLRTIGFAATPGLFQVFAAMPGMTVPVFGVTAVWMLVAMIIAVRQALDFEHTSRAIAVCALGGALSLAIALAMGIVLAPTVS
jgi:hypothetical protein